MVRTASLQTYDETGIRTVSSDGVVATLAGSGAPGCMDCGSGAALTAKFRGPTAVVCDDGGFVYVADSGNHRIRVIAPDGTVWFASPH